MFTFHALVKQSDNVIKKYNPKVILIFLVNYDQYGKIQNDLSIRYIYVFHICDSPHHKYMSQRQDMVFPNPIFHVWTVYDLHGVLATKVAFCIQEEISQNCRPNEKSVK